MANEHNPANVAAGATEQESRAVAEDARQKEWSGRGFLRELFLGNFRFDWVDGEMAQVRPEAEAFHRRLRAFLEREVDSAEIDHGGQYPSQVTDGLRALG